ncbi:MAG: ketoacyl-ACP synthase III [Proteobacteria bacterium]|nr:ketoacyl-ACP synthase III [Pseudomonadota bacterium]
MALPWPIRIAGVGRYLPERVVTNAEIATLCDVPVEWIEDHCGVRERRWAEPELGETNSWMAAQAINEALEEAEFDGRSLDLIINASGTTEQMIPDGGPLIQRQLGLEDTAIPCVSVHSTCLSFLQGLQMAGALLTAGTHSKIALVSSEIASIGLEGAERETPSLFGDAAAAAILTSSAEGSSQFESIRFETYGAAAHLTEVRGCGSRRPPNHPDTVPADHVFHMDGPAILQFCLDRTEGFLERLVPGLSQELGDIDIVVPHQPSRVGLQAMFNRPWPEAARVDTLATLGNMVAAGIPVNLYEAVHLGKLTRGSRALLWGLGAGVSFGGAVITY